MSTATKAAHTPGPWECHDWRVIGWNGTRCEVICDTANNKATRTLENRINARLIAAAPEMLEALENLADYCLRIRPIDPLYGVSNKPNAVLKAEAAIYKAKVCK